MENLNELIEYVKENNLLNKYVIVYYMGEPYCTGYFRDLEYVFAPGVFGLRLYRDTETNKWIDISPFHTTKIELVEEAEKNEI